VGDIERYLVQILLPMYDNTGSVFGEEAFGPTRAELTEQFGGLTAYQRAPARGLWKTGDGELERDDVAIFEVMADRVDAAWWRDYRTMLEARFRQDVIVVRAMRVELL
jgi:hypothetical protein